MSAGSGLDEFDRKDRAKRVRRVVVIVLLGLFVLATYMLYRERQGSWPGELLNKPAVQNYLRKNYSDEGSFKVTYSHFDKARKRYVYNCSCASGEFTMSASSFTLRYDGYAHDYLSDLELEAQTEQYFRDYLAANFDSGSASYELSLRLSVPASETAGGSIGEGIDDEISKAAGNLIAGGLKKYGQTARFDVSFHGGEITFSEYKELVYGLLDALRGTLYRAPDFLQVFYYRTDAEAEGGEVLAYESHLVSYMFNYNRDGFMKATDVNFYVEITGRQAASLKRYSIIQTVVIGSIILLIVVAVVMRIVRKRK